VPSTRELALSAELLALGKQHEKSVGMLGAIQVS
jgi:hypothetical protein